jgi:hypothetical protein
MLHNLEPVGEAAEPQTITPEQQEPPYNFGNITSQLSRESLSSAHKELLTQESWEGNNAFASISTIASTRIQMTHDFSNAQPQMFDQRLCKQDKFSLKELEIGIAKGGSIFGTKLSPATRQENLLAG